MKLRKAVKQLSSYYFSELKKCMKDFKNKDTRKKQIPNMLTFSRAVAPVFILPLIFTGNFVPASIVTACFASTDFFDGFFARKFNAYSKFGKELDPIVDKIFASSLLIPLIFHNPLILLNLSLELGISIINSYSKFKGNNPKTNVIGKIKTWALSILVICNYYSLLAPISKIVTNIMFATTTMLQVSAAIKYYKEDLDSDKSKVNNKINTNTVKKNYDNEKIKKIEKLISILKCHKNTLINENKNVEDYKKTLHM